MQSISTKSLQNLPDIHELKKRLQSLAVLDLIMSPDWQDRFYSFNANWSEGECMGSMRNGCGDSFHVLFNANGCFFKGMDHESEFSSWDNENSGKWIEALKKVPEAFADGVNEPAFEMDDISFCYWRTFTDENWQWISIGDVDGDDPDGSEYLLNCLNGDPVAYQVFVEEYFEEDIPLAPIRQIYAHQTITQEIIDMLNPMTKLKDIQAELVEIGYLTN